MSQGEVGSLELIITLTDELSDELESMQSLYDSIATSVEGVGSELTGVADGIAESTVEIVSGFDTMAEESLASLGSWDEALSAWFQTTVQQFEAWKESIIGSGGALSGLFDGVQSFFASLSTIEVKWPNIPNPFAGIDWCGQVPYWVRDALGICGGVLPTYSPPAQSSAGSVPAPSGGRISGAGSYASGGYVDKDGGTVHKGEWVIPTQGGPVLTGGRDMQMNVTYNIDKITGIDDFERTMEAHDRKLLRQLQTLM